MKIAMNMFCSIQKKCEQYWPEQINVTETKGSKFKVTVTSFVPSAEYQIRKIHLTPVSDLLLQLVVVTID